MPHGSPDWGAMASKETIYSLADLGEVVARLGGIMTYDRGGDLAWFDSFEHGYPNWSTALAGTGAAVALTADRFLSNGYSLKLTGGSDGSAYAAIAHSLFLPVLGRLGVEWHFALDNNPSIFSLDFYAHDGAAYRRYAVRYDHVNSRWQYLNASSVWTVLATGVGLYYNTYLFNACKLIFDESTKKFVKLKVNRNEYSLADLAVPEVAGVQTPHFDINFRNTSQAGTNAVVYLDDIIITQNEP